MIKIKHVSIFLVFGLIISMSFSVATPVKSLSFTGGFYSVQNLRYSCSSLCTYWVHGANAWNNISTKVHSSRHYGVDSDGHARLYGTTTTVSGLLGQVFPYTQYGVGVDPIYDGTGTGRWVFAIGVLYTNNLTSDQMRRAVAVHEFGHILSQKHNSYTNSVMYPSYGTNRLLPSNYDKGSLITRWGN